MKSHSLVALTFLAALAAAVPMAHQHHKRDVVVYTVTQEVVEVINVVKTVWVPAGPAAATETSSSSQSSSSSSQTSSSSSSTPAQYVAAGPVADSPVHVTPTPPTPAVPDATPSPSSTSKVPDTPPPPPPPAPKVYDTTPPPAEPKIKKPASPSPSPDVYPTKESSGNNYVTKVLPGAKVPNGCTAGAPCKGDMTFYNPSVGVGACGYKPDGSIYTDSDKVVAVSVGMMGSLSSGQEMNELCWRNIIIVTPDGKNDTGTVVDKCFGCKHDTDIDLSPALYNELADEATGRVGGVKWYWAPPRT